ncbi:MAG: Mobile element protein, partial [uncultured Rubrobacteraceae bacterium]
DPASRKRGVRVEDGSSARPLRRALRSAFAGSLLRRASLPAHRRCDRASAAEAGPSRQVRLTLPERWHLPRAHEFRAPNRLAAGAGHKASQEAGVRPFDAPPGGGGLPARQEDPGGPRQPLDPYCRGLLRELYRRASTALGAQDRVLLHAGAWLLAEHGGDRTLGTGAPVPQKKIARHGDIGPGGGSMANRAKPVGSERGVALHHRGCAHQATQPLPFI